MALWDFLSGTTVSHLPANEGTLSIEQLIQKVTAIQGLRRVRGETVRVHGFTG